MRLLYIADGRSPIAVRWIEHFVATGHEVHLVSTFECMPPLPLASLTIAPVAFSGRSRAAASQAGRQPRGASLGGVRFRTAVRQWLGPLTVRGAAEKVRETVRGVRPELVHAMRIPFEGMLAATAEPEAPLLISVWGNDFTLHARASPGLAALTRRAVNRADGIHADCVRDLRLAREWGYPQAGASLVAPGNGGVRPELFGADVAARELDDTGVGYVLHTLSPQAEVVINPRGLRAYVRTDTFFRSLPLILEARPEAEFLCPGMAGRSEPEAWIRRLGLRRGVHLLPALTPRQMAALFSFSAVSISASEHDGTPNTLLEAMAGGAFPVAGDLESVREWIEPGVNGFLFDPADPEALASAIIAALEDGVLRSAAARRNRELVAERAAYSTVMANAEAFYARIVRSWHAQ